VPELRRAGAGAAGACRLAASFALSRKLLGEPLPRGAHFASPKQIFDHYRGALRDKKREMFLVVLLDARHRVLRDEVVSEGSLTSSIVHPREVFLPAVRESAGAVVLVHNHPSGDPSPSDDDVAVTRRLVHASELLGIKVLDHVIVGDGVYASFRERGLL
jgi:DNA repair protein RadC